jgi:hypothetical protein
VVQFIKMNRYLLNLQIKSISNNTFLRTIENTTIKYENNKITYIDTKIKSKKVEPLKMDLIRYTKYGSFDIETA